MQNNCDKSEMIYAGFWIRLAAYLIDSVIVFVGLLFVRLCLSGVMAVLKDTPLGGNILFHFSLKDIILYIAGALYFVLFTYYTGSTLGKRAMNLKVVSKDGERPNFIDVLYRETIGKFLCKATLGIGYIMVGFDPKKRGLHDMLCDTQVIFAKKILVIRDERRISEHQVKSKEEAFAETAIESAESAETVICELNEVKEKTDTNNETEINNEGVHN